MNDYLELKPLHEALKCLIDSVEVTSNIYWLSLQEEKVKASLSAGAIKNFKMLHDVCMHIIKTRIEMDSASVNGCDDSDYRDLFRMAGEVGLITSVELWFTYHKIRVKVGRNYCSETINEAQQLMTEVMKEARILLLSLEARN